MSSKVTTAIGAEQGNDKLFPKTIKTQRSEKSLSSDQVLGMVKNIEGRILTVIDAMFAEGQQRNAMKSLVREAIYSSYDQVDSWVLQQDIESGSTFPFVIPGRYLEQR